MKKKDEKIIRGAVEELLKLLEVEGSFEITPNDGGIDIVLTTEDSGIVIGYHGDMLASLQLVLSLCIAKKLGEFVRVSLEVGDYKKNRTDWLTNVTYETKQRVLTEGRELSLPDLKPWERRVVHMLLSDDQEVATESIGEGKDRVLVIKPKS